VVRKRKTNLVVLAINEILETVAVAVEAVFVLDNDFVALLNPSGIEVQTVSCPFDLVQAINSVEFKLADTLAREIEEERVLVVLEFVQSSIETSDDTASVGGILNLRERLEREAKIVCHTREDSSTGSGELFLQEVQVGNLGLVFDGGHLTQKKKRNKSV